MGFYWQVDIGPHKKSRLSSFMCDDAAIYDRMQAPELHLACRLRGVRWNVAFWNEQIVFFFDIHLVNRKDPTLKKKWKENMVVDFFWNSQIT